MDYVWGDNESMSNSPTALGAKLHKRHNILLFLYVLSMISLYVISMISHGYILAKHYSGNTAALFLDDTLEVDVSIAEGSIIGILGSDRLSNYCYILAVKRSEKPMNRTNMCGQTIVETGMYTTVRRLLLVQ